MQRLVPEVRAVSIEDIFLANGEKKVPRDRAATIDIIIRPTDNDTGKILDAFPEGSYWLALWGEGISQDELENEFVGIRTQIKWDSTRENTILRISLRQFQNY